MNKQKGFSKIYTILIILVVIGLAWFYIIPTYNEMTFQKKRADSYREYVANNPSKEVPETIEKSTSSSEQNNDKATFNSQEEMNAVRTENAEYEGYVLDRNGIVPNGWVEKDVKTNDNTTLKLIVPNEYKDIISLEIINKKTDSKPENFALNTIGGSVLNIKQYSIYTGGEKKVTQYSFVTSTNYKWNTYEVSIDDNTHLEIGYSYKSELDNPKLSFPSDKIIGSIKVE